MPDTPAQQSTPPMPEWWDAMWRAMQAHVAAAKPHGCVCPVGAEATCQGLGCPRRAFSVTPKWPGADQR